MAPTGVWRAPWGRCPLRSSRSSAELPPGPRWYYKKYMMFFRSLLFLCPAACLLAQTPPPPPPPVPASAPASGSQGAAPQNRVVNKDGSVTMTLPLPAAAPQVPPETVILTVGDLTITAQQFEEITDGMQDQYKNFFKGPGRRQFADQLVKVLTLAQEGKRRKLDQMPAFQAQLIYQDEQALANFTYVAITKDVKIDD